MIALILAGGSGTRLWPLSRSFYAKQFIKFNSVESLLYGTVKLASRHCEDIVVVTNETQYFLVKHQLEGLKFADENIIKEPVGRNTAAAIALGCRFIQDKYGDTDVLVMPSDHILEESFFQTVRKAKDLGDKYVATFGVKPTYPSTGYGYIKLGEKKGEWYLADGFYEKPDEKRATEYIASGRYLWNSGIFYFSTRWILQALSEHQPEINKYLSSMNELLENYETLPNISIDHGVMEKTEDIIVIPYAGGWSDVGSWRSVYDILDKDDSGNAKKGDIIDLNTKNSLIIGEDRLIATIGLKDIILVDTKDALLVAERSEAEAVREVVKKLNDAGRSESLLHSTVYRPWGYYTVLESGHRYKVKRIAVYPGKSLSLQLHHHRAEHWVVVKGTARITKNDRVINVHENESIYVPKSTRHRLENTGKIDLHIIEVQTGEYLEEDDIERYEDEYGRA